MFSWIMDPLSKAILAVLLNLSELTGSVEPTELLNFLLLIDFLLYLLLVVWDPDRCHLIWTMITLWLLDLGERWWNTVQRGGTSRLWQWKHWDWETNNCQWGKLWRISKVKIQLLMLYISQLWRLDTSKWWKQTSRDLWDPLSEPRKGKEGLWTIEFKSLKEFPLFHFQDISSLVWCWSSRAKFSNRHQTAPAPSWVQCHWTKQWRCQNCGQWGCWRCNHSHRARLCQTKLWS